MNYPTVTITGIKNKPFELAKPFRVELSNGHEMYIPKGYWTDFASVPKVFRLFIDHVGQDGGAFIAHDYMYNFGGYKVNPRVKRRTEFSVTREFADEQMRYLMGQYGASKLRQFLFFWAVRLGGLFHFRTI